MRLELVDCDMLTLLSSTESPDWSELEPGSQVGNNYTISQD